MAGFLISRLVGRERGNGAGGGERGNRGRGRGVMIRGRGGERTKKVIKVK